VACRIRFSFDLEAAERLSHITGQIDRRTLRQALFSGLQDCVQVAKSFTPYEEGPSGAHISTMGHRRQETSSLELMARMRRFANKGYPSQVFF